MDGLENMKFSKKKIPIRRYLKDVFGFQNSLIANDKAEVMKET